MQSLYIGRCSHSFHLQANKPFEPHADRDNVQDLIEAENSDELEQLEDDFADDPFLEQYR